MYVCHREARECLYGQTGARKKNLVYKDRCTFVFYELNVLKSELNLQITIHLKYLKIWPGHFFFTRTEFNMI